MAARRTGEKTFYFRKKEVKFRKRKSFSPLKFARSDLSEKLGGEKKAIELEVKGSFGLFLTKHNTIFHTLFQDVFHSILESFRGTRNRNVRSSRCVTDELKKSFISRSLVLYTISTSNLAAAKRNDRRMKAKTRCPEDLETYSKRRGTWREKAMEKGHKEICTRSGRSLRRIRNIV